MAGFILVYLLSTERWRQAGAWILAVSLCGFGIFIAKLLFQSCIMVTAAGNISGHTAMSTMVYGGFALLVFSRPIRWPSATIAAIAAMLVVAIAASRIVLHAHDWWEVVAGLVAGLSAILVFRLVAGEAEGPTRLVGLMVGAVLMAALLHGAHLPVDQALNNLSERIQLDTPRCKAAS